MAAGGTRFTSAYTNCPICVPGRAAVATGQYVHKARCWDNAIAYRGDPPTWGHRLMALGLSVACKLLHLRYAHRQADQVRSAREEEELGCPQRFNRRLRCHRPRRCAYRCPGAGTAC
ncbi:MAG: sulfatase-like hydrolase/transferase [Burkholderiales bacterium]|nr:sulfatase-like hydrolase/transferase [Burkholderiales bacterium]